MTDHGYARSVATWACNPTGFSWDEVKPLNFTPRYSWDDICRWAKADVRGRGIIGQRLEEILDRIDGVIP